MSSNVSSFFQGMQYLFKGIKAYYTDSTLWGYGLLPLLLLFGLYILLFGACCFFFEGWIFCLVLVILLLIIPLTVSLLYEAAGGIFFDLLIGKYVKKHSFAPPPETAGKFISFIVDSVLFNLGTIFLTFLLLPVLLIPFAGQIIFLFVIGNRNGKVWVLPALYFYGKKYKENKKLLGEKKYLITGFGVMLTLFLSIPFAALFLLPSFILGGLLLVKDNLLDEE